MQRRSDLLIQLERRAPVGELMEAICEKSEVRILVVDDHPLTRDMVSSILKGIGFGRLDQAENGHIALLKLNEGEFDLIICDWNMPTMSGLEVLEEIRSEERFKDIPFLMLTAEAYRENVAAAMKAGVTDYIAKPFTADVLSKKIEQILRESGVLS